MAHIPARVVYTPAPITYNTPQKLKPFTNFVNLTPYKPSTEEEPEKEPEKEPEEEREGKLIVEEERSIDETAEKDVTFNEQSKIEEPSREVILVEFSPENAAAQEVETMDPLGPPEKGRTGPGIMHPFVDLGEEVEIVAEEGSLAESEKLVIESILITSTEPIQSSSTTTTLPTGTTTTSPPTSVPSSSPQKTERTSVHPLPFPFQTTTAASETITSEAPPTTTTSSERMEKLLEMAMERLKEMEETSESS